MGHYARQLHGSRLSVHYAFPCHYDIIIMTFMAKYFSPVRQNDVTERPARFLTLQSCSAEAKMNVSGWLNLYVEFVWVVVAVVVVVVVVVVGGGGGLELHEQQGNG